MLEALIARSGRELSTGYYTQTQAEAITRHVFGVDTQLIADRTYFVAFDGEQMVGCGGWSHRAKFFTGGDVEADPRSLDPASEAARIRAMFVRSDQARRGIGRAILAACEEEARQAGFRTLELMATLPGLPLYQACGYTVEESAEIVLPDGVRLGAARMRKVLGA